MGITGVIYSFGGIILGIIVGIATHGVGLILMIVLLFAYGVAYLVYLILAAVAAYRGDLYRVPAAICLPMVH